LHHHVEGFVGVVDDQVLLPDGGEAIAGMVADATSPMPSSIVLSIVGPVMSSSR